MAVVLGIVRRGTVLAPALDRGLPDCRSQSGHQKQKQMIVGCSQLQLDRTGVGVGADAEADADAGGGYRYAGGTDWCCSRTAQTELDLEMVLCTTRARYSDAVAAVVVAVVSMVAARPLGICPVCSCYESPHGRAVHRGGTVVVDAVGAGTE